MNLTEFSKEVHENAVAHGWWEKEKSFPEIIALIHSELSEALEEYRDNKPMVYYNCRYDSNDVCPCISTKCEEFFKDDCCKQNALDQKPKGIAIELADAVIRILDYCGRYGIDIEKAIEIKHEYNKTRPYKHGGKKI